MIDNPNCQKVGSWLNREPHLVLHQEVEGEGIHGIHGYTTTMAKAE